MMSLMDGQILCFYEAINPNGEVAGLNVGFDGNTPLDHLVSWAHNTSRDLPPGHDFHRAIYVKVHLDPVDDPYRLPSAFPQNSSGSYDMGGREFWASLVLEVAGGSFDEEE